MCTAPLSVYSSAEAGRSDSHGGAGGGAGGGADGGAGGGAGGRTPSVGAAGGTPRFAHGWRYYADRPSKFGWIATERGATVGFELRFGAAPRFALTYLRSYEKVGRIELRLPAIGYTVVVDAHWVDRASQSDVLWFGTTPGHDTTISYNTHHVPGLLPNATHVLEARLLAAPSGAAEKFKIVQLVSC